MTDRSAPRCPSGLGPSGRRLWRRIAAEFSLDDHGLELLEVACRAADRAAACRERIDDEGEVYHDRFNQPKPHVLLAAERDSNNLVLRALRDLNLDLPVEEP